MLGIVNSFSTIVSKLIPRTMDPQRIKVWLGDNFLISFFLSSSIFEILSTCELLTYSVIDYRELVSYTMGSFGVSFANAFIRS